jgi:glyoxylase-like metal-dependent hydrolase (beta-lactamase superfamily II)
MPSPADIAHLAPSVVRIRADNPSPLTGTGSNCYILHGEDGAAVLVDAGPARGWHIGAIHTALAGASLTAILITHPHLDHSGGAAQLSAQTGAKVYSFGAPKGRNNSASEGTDFTHRPDIALANGAQVTLAGLTITAIQTPGHMQGHLCFGWRDILFSGDHVMGWASTLVAPPEGDMAAYRASLRALLGLNYARYFPGHGEVIETPKARIAELIAHRDLRERQILAALTLGPASAATLAASIYTEIPAPLMPAAAQSVQAHLIELAAKGQVHSARGPQGAVIYTLN